MAEIQNLVIPAKAAIQFLHLIEMHKKKERDDQPFGCWRTFPGSASLSRNDGLVIVSMVDSRHHHTCARRAE